MKIAFIYDVCNNLFLLSKYLRAQGHLVDLYVVRGRGHNTLPENDDASLAQGYPDWIKVVEPMRYRNFLFFKKTDLFKTLSEYDIVAGSAEIVLFADKIPTKTAFCVSGMDLFQRPFYFNKVILNNFRAGNYKQALYQMLLAHRAKRGIRGSKGIISDDVDVYRQKVIEVGADLRNYYPTPSYVLLDDQRFNRNPMPNIDFAFRNREIDRNRVVIFMPSRLLFDDRLSDKASGDWKANDVLFHAIAKLPLETKRRVELVLLDSVMSRDVQLAKTLITKLGIEEQVVWLWKKDKVAFTRNELLELYSLSDIVVDDFGLGWMGSIAIEGLLMGCHLITYADKSIPKYGSVPFDSVREVDDVSALIQKYCLSPQELQVAKDRGRDWALYWHGLENGGKRYEDIFRKIVSQN